MYVASCRVFIFVCIEFATRIIRAHIAVMTRVLLLYCMSNVSIGTNEYSYLVLTDIDTQQPAKQR